MERPSVWLMLVILLTARMFLSEPRLQQYDEGYLRWLLTNTRPLGPVVPLTVVEIGSESGSAKKNADKGRENGLTVSPVELALFLQAALEFQPTVVGFESILQWRGQNKEQDQIFLDQAMHVPAMLTAAELTATPDLDAPVVEIQGFPNVTGHRGALPEFSGIGAQPDEDIRVVSTPGYINLPPETTNEIHAPLLFQYRGKVIPSFALQAAMLWMRITPPEVKINLDPDNRDSHIALPNGKKIPIRDDGTLLITPNAIKRAHQLTLNELLLAAQQHETKAPSPDTTVEKDGLILARISGEQHSAHDLFAATVATIQSGVFVRRVNRIFDYCFILLLVLASAVVRRFSRVDIILVAIAVTAAYCLSALGMLARWAIWLPGVLPFSTIWLVAVFCIFAPRKKDDPDLPTVAPPPPSL